MKRQDAVVLTGWGGGEPVSHHRLANSGPLGRLLFQLARAGSSRPSASPPASTTSTPAAGAASPGTAAATSNAGSSSVAAGIGPASFTPRVYPDHSGRGQHQIYRAGAG